MKIAEIAIENKTTTLVITFCVLVGGVMSYRSLARLDNPLTGHRVTDTR